MPATPEPTAFPIPFNKLPRLLTFKHIPDLRLFRSAAAAWNPALGRDSLQAIADALDRSRTSIYRAEKDLAQLFNTAFGFEAKNRFLLFERSRVGTPCSGLTRQGLIALRLTIEYLDELDSEAERHKKGV